MKARKKSMMMSQGGGAVQPDKEDRLSLKGRLLLWVIKRRLQSKKEGIMAEAWKWLNGHKTEIGGTVTVLSVQIPVLFQTMGIDPTQVAFAGAIVTGIGLIHKVCKGLGWAKPVIMVK